MQVFDELKRRNVIKATIAYIVVAWILLQFIAIILPNFEAPSWVFKSLTFVIIIGLPIWIIFSWVYEVTPEGLKKTSKVSKKQSISEVTNKRLNIVIIIMLILAIGLSFVNKPFLIYSSESNTGSDLVIENSIAVLPFVNMSSDKEQEYFADGLSEELLNMFTRIPQLKVTGRTSSFSFKGKNEDLRDIGTKLNVNYILEGSVRKSKNKIRVTAQLIQARDGYHLWSKTYDRSLDDIFEVQDNIASAVVNALRITLLNSNPASSKKKMHPEAYNYFLRGKYFYESTPISNSNEEALLWFNKAIEKDSTFSLAWTYRGMIFWRYSKNSIDNDFLEAKKSSIRAFELDNTSGIAAVNVGEILDNEYNFEEALKFINKGLELNPNDPYVLRNVGRFYTLIGRESESITYCKKALENDPIQKTALGYLLESHYHNKQYEEVKQLIIKYQNLYPNILYYRESITSLIKLGENEELLDEINKILAERRNEHLASRLLYLDLINAYNNNNKKEVNEKINQLVLDYPDNRYLIALAHSYIGNKSKAIDWLYKSFLKKDHELVYINCEPEFDFIRNEPQFKELINKMNFPE